MSSKKAKSALKVLLTEKLLEDLKGLPVEMSPKKIKRNIKKASKILLAGAKLKTSEAKTPQLPAPAVS